MLKHHGGHDWFHKIWQNYVMTIGSQNLCNRWIFWSPFFSSPDKNLISRNVPNTIQWIDLHSRRNMLWHLKFIPILWKVNWKKNWRLRTKKKPSILKVTVKVWKAGIHYSLQMKKIEVIEHVWNPKFRYKEIFKLLRQNIHDCQSKITNMIILLSFVL